MKGFVKWYNVPLGYGFIQGDDGVDVFVHKSDVPFWTIFLTPGDKLEYQKEETEKGLKATNIEML
ncbi:MAG: cold shock domain-containing protein [Candidatus Thermoplasmatota archaeon]|nr:cold shock domain-containing protein [Candidatus Thermoplasmatota archaeon]